MKKKTPPSHLLEEMEAHVATIEAAHRAMDEQYRALKLTSYEVNLEIGRKICSQYHNVRMVMTIETGVEGDESIRIEPIKPNLPQINVEGGGFAWSFERVSSIAKEIREGRYWPSPETLRAFIAGYKQGKKQGNSSSNSTPMGTRDLQDVLDRTR